MTGMEIAEHVDMLQLEGNRMATASEEAGADAPVPSCGDWAVRDLLQHQGGVFRWSAAYVAQGKTQRDEDDWDRAVGPLPDDTHVFEWYRQSHQKIVDALRNADPELQCWTFGTAPSPLAFWARRQAHEASIHRVDAELAAELTPEVVPAAFAVDGLDELLLLFLRRHPGDQRASSPRTMAVRCDDIDASWLVTLSAEGLAAERSEGTSDCTVHGRASDLYHALWNRLPAAALHSTGDASAIDLFIEEDRMRWTI
jgi:uncharacterized protein (TIGR03083 family)